MTYEIRTDLALESGERIFKRPVEIRGVRIEEEKNEFEDIKTTIVNIESENGSKAMGKPQGKYITIEAPNLLEGDDAYGQQVAEEIARQMKNQFLKKEEQAVLVVGLGNQNVTPDALGPWTIERLKVTRHLILAYGKDCLGYTPVCKISALRPGVMATTGMETLEIIRGVVKETNPDLVIVIDALAARGVKRLGRTIQMTDTGVHPGSGVGNYREGITRETLGVPVLGIGVPTVVDAATIVCDAMEHLMENLEYSERQQFLQEMLTPNLRSMFVTPRDVDESVRILSETISRGINFTFTSQKDCLEMSL